MKNRKYYAEENLGRDKTEILVFKSKKARDEYVSTTDYTNKITAREAHARIDEIEPSLR